jgi:type I restriction enzyme S subunit
LDGAEALRSKRRAALALLDELTQSIFLDVFGDPSERIVSGGIEFGSVVEEFRYGTSNKSGSNGFLTLRIPNVIGASIELTDLKLVQVDDAEFSRLRLLHGDLLFVRTNGNPDNVGRCAVFEENLIADSGCDPKEFIYASYLIRARLKSSVMPVFIRELMLTFEGRKNLRAAAKTSAGQYNINTQGLGSLPIFVPPIDLQRIFVDRVQVVNGLKAVLEKSQSELDQLFASLQHRAFRGEL